MKIKLCDNKIEGHHKGYFNSLLNIEGTYLKLSSCKSSVSLKKSPIKYILEVNELVKDYIGDFEKEIIHFLVIDNLYFSTKSLKNIKAIGTLHQIPNDKIRKIFLKNFVKKLEYVIVHSEFLKDELEKIGIKNIKVINYPSFYEYKNLDKIKIKEKLNIKKEKKILSCLGGTRQDKGYEILFEAFKYLGEKYKKNIIFNFAGKANYYNHNFIIEKCKENNIDYRCDIREITDAEFLENVFITDIMLMPYLKSFGGNSGPMTEAIVNKIPCITPKDLNIGKINLKNNLGEVFECENSKSLAKAIERTIENLDKGIYYNTDFYKELTEKKFLEEYRKIYEKVWSDLENE